VSHLLSVLHQAGSTTLDGAGYGYDFAGNRTSKTNYLNGTTSNYGYDAIYELQQVTQSNVTTESYSFDAVGNRLTSLGVNPYSYNTSNELTAIPSGSYTYDANGNTLSDPSGKSYTWDFENRLTQAIVPGTGTTAFRYDPFGRRIQKSGPLGTTNYLYDGMSATVAEEVDNGGNELASYAPGAGMDQPIAEFRSSTASYYMADGLGSITSLSSASGALANTYTYDSFGKLTAFTGSLTNALQFTARDSDTETGLYYYRARYYDPQTGRFLSEDPTEFDGGSLNFYTYVGNRPTTFTDPSGLRVLNPNDYPVSGNVMGALQTFNKCIGCDKDVVITGGDRPPSATIGAGSNSTHVTHLAADIVVPGQLNILTANQAEQCGGFGGIGWYQEGYQGPKGEGPHVHLDLRGSAARWGYYADGRETHGYIPFYPTEINLPPFGCGTCQ